MAKGLPFLIMALAMLFVTAKGFAQNGQGKSLPTTAPDLSGLWLRPKEVDARAALHFTNDEPPMQPGAAERYGEIRKGRKGVNEYYPDVGREDLDPGRPPFCMPHGFPRVYATTDAFEIVPSPGRVYILFEDGETQRIYTDGQGFPKGPPLTFMGQSIGRWDGDTLVVETKDMNDLTWLDGWGHLHSDVLRVEQRIRRVDHDTLEINFLFDDPKTYLKPWSAKKVYKLRSNSEYVMNYFICEDPKQEEFLEKAMGKKESP